MAAVERQGGALSALLDGFYGLLQEAMTSARMEHERAAWGRMSTPEPVELGSDRLGSFTALAEHGDLYGAVPEHDGKVPAFHMTDDRGLAEFQETQASLEPSKQEPRLSDLYGPEHYPEVAGFVEPDHTAFQSWMQREGSSLMDDMRGQAIRVDIDAARLGVDTSAPNTSPGARSATSPSLGEHKAEQVLHERTQEDIDQARLGIQPSKDYEPIRSAHGFASFAELARQPVDVPDRGLGQELER